MRKNFLFNRMELSGSLGDLGTILPLSIAMVIMNGVHAFPVYLCFGLYYIASGLYFRVTSPVEPMKIIAAYAIASNLSIAEIQASGLIMALFLLVIGSTGFISTLAEKIPLSVIRGVQMSTGILLAIKGFQLIIGTSSYQQFHGLVEPHLSVQSIGPVPVGIFSGVLLFLLTLYLLDNKKMPAALSLICIGLVLGFFLYKGNDHPIATPGFTFPSLLPYGFPTVKELSFALLFLVLPQIPTTIGNAVIANKDLTHKYFPETGKKVTARSLCLSMGFANLCSFILGGIPMCHGAGGLASRYRFGARTGGSNIIIGMIFLSAAFFFGENIVVLLTHIPLSVLGVLLVFAGTQLSLSLLDVKKRKDLFVIIIMLGITLAANLGAAFIAGIAVALVIQSEKVTI